jgi:hypothetical protein
MEMTMAKAEPARETVSPEAVLQSFEDTREEAAHAWSRACTLYSHYFAALAKADTPAAIMQANADLVSRGIEAMGKSMTALQHIGGPARQARH